MSLGAKARFDPPSASKVEAPPPVYSRERPAARADGPVDPIRPLNLSVYPGPDVTTTSTKDECIAHLKLLAAFADLRDAIGKSDGLFSIHNREIDKFRGNPNTMNEAAALLCEKRWQVYVTRAVERFTTWWQKCVPTCGVDGLDSFFTVKDVEQGKILAEAPTCKTKITWTPDTMPPLGSLFLSHSFLFCLIFDTNYVLQMLLWCGTHICSIHDHFLRTASAIQK
jgi:hypothetical protein